MSGNVTFPTQLMGSRSNIHDRICEPVVFLSGNLYSRHIQVDGEMLAIQVQDTPGVQVS